MAVFINSKRKAVALISYKVLFSRFLYTDAWNIEENWPSCSIFLRHLIRRSSVQCFSIVRHPERRILSYFMDKFRIQPELWQEDGFEWQPCHKATMKIMGISAEQPTEQIAQAFLDMSFDRFVDALPRLYALDAHTCPQAWATKLRFYDRRTITWPGVKIFRLEDGIQQLEGIPDVNFGEKTNQSSHKERDFIVSEKNRSILRHVYAADYRLGGYK